MKYLLGIDIGTTSLKAVVTDENAKVCKTLSIDYTLNTHADFVEFPADRYWEIFSKAYTEVTAQYKIFALSIDTQCETLIVTDKSGTPLMDAIVWLDNRAVTQADKIKARFGEQKIYEMTGQPEVTATWPACKLLWLKENKPELFSKIARVFLLEDYIIFKLTGEFVTQGTLQSSSLYFDIINRCWWEDMLEYIGLDNTALPQICHSGKVVGYYGDCAVVTGVMDQIAGAMGAGVIKKGIVSEMTGTTMAVFVKSDKIPPYNPNVKIPCHLNFDGSFCLLLWTATAGIALKWFKNNFCEDFKFSELDNLAEKVNPGSDGLTFLPYLCGSTIPKYNPDAKGAFIGLTMEHTRAHFVRSILEAVACMLKMNIDYLGIPCDEIRSMGGGAQSKLWCQIKSNVLNKKIVTLQNDETAGLGSAIMAGVAVGVFDSIEQACQKAVIIKDEYLPDSTDYTGCYKRFCELTEYNT